jgi:hypothetical protein
MSAVDGDRICAFPCLDDSGSGLHMRESGMSLRQYAAIKLKVPDSGIDWLDAMILKSLRDDFALANVSLDTHYAYAVADAMLAARKGGAS